jgi:hypothetical protein
VRRPNSTVSKRAMNEVEPLNYFAVRPATAEVRLTVEPIVEGTRKMKIFGDEIVEGGPVLRHVAS